MPRQYGLNLFYGGCPIGFIRQEASSFFSLTLKLHDWLPLGSRFDVQEFLHEQQVAPHYF
jgi:hypothetical protein